MTIKSHVLGPGTLTLGSGPLAVEAQVTKIVIQWSESVETEAAIPVLSGEELAEQETPTVSAALAITFLQDDLASSGVIAWSWTNAATDQPFTWEPNSTLDRKIDGTVTIVPINVGGDVKKRNTSDVTWRCPKSAALPTISDAD